MLKSTNLGDKNFKNFVKLGFLDFNVRLLSDMGQNWTPNISNADSACWLISALEWDLETLDISKIFSKLYNMDLDYSWLSWYYTQLKSRRLGFSSRDKIGKLNLIFEWSFEIADCFIADQAPLTNYFHLYKYLSLYHILPSWHNILVTLTFHK